MKKMTLCSVLCLILITLLINVASGAEKTGKRIIVDQLGRSVAIPQKVTRVVCLMHHALNIMLELQAGDTLVGVIKGWDKLLLDGIKDIYPRLKTLPTPGDLSTVNMEEVLKLNPDVVIVTHYFPSNLIKKMEDAGLAVVAISLYTADFEQASKLNPKLLDPDKAYTVGLKQGVTLLGEILGKQAKAKELNDFIAEKRALVGNRVSDIPETKRTRCYIANPNLYTYGSGKYPGVIMNRAGGVNVAREIDGYKQVDMEQILVWNPEVIFVQDRYANVAQQIQKDSAWKGIKAVKDHRVYLTPEYVKPWGHPCPESMALGELWMGKKLYPDRFKDIDMSKIVNEFYTRFYGVPYKGSH